MSILTRIKELATEKGITIAELERKTNMGNGVIRRWDKHLPTTDKLQKVALELNTTLDYLVNGKETTDEKIVAIGRKASILTPEQLSIVNTMIDAFLEQQKEEKL